jgi:hypothetical protein
MKKKLPAKKDKKIKKSSPEKKEENTTDAFDFGGLPRRDLKKNLGCG